jgi:hypothetical protein
MNFSGVMHDHLRPEYISVFSLPKKPSHAALSGEITGRSPAFNVPTALSGMVLTRSVSGRVLRDLLTTLPSKQSTTGDSQTFPAGSRNSVISVSIVRIVAYLSPAFGAAR